jgi:hypothetical protein
MTTNDIPRLAWAASDPTRPIGSGPGSSCGAARRTRRRSRSCRVGADFLKMKREIDQVKEGAAAARVEQIRKDLELLLAKNLPEYERLRSALSEVLQA